MFLVEIREEWRVHTELVLEYWRDVLESYRPGAEQQLVDTYWAYVSDLLGDRYPGMFDPDPTEDAEALLEHILVELYRFHTEKVFGESYIDSSDFEEKLRDELMMYTNRWANAVGDAMTRVWDESAVPGPTH